MYVYGFDVDFFQIIWSESEMLDTFRKITCMKTSLAIIGQTVMSNGSIFLVISMFRWSILRHCRSHFLHHTCPPIDVTVGNMKSIFSSSSAEILKSGALKRPPLSGCTSSQFGVRHGSKAMKEHPQ